MALLCGVFMDWLSEGLLATVLSLEKGFQKIGKCKYGNIAKKIGFSGVFRLVCGAFLCTRSIRKTLEWPENGQKTARRSF